MLHKLSPKTLLILLLVSIGIFTFLTFFNKKGRSKSFKSELVKIDTANVTKVIIEKQGQATYLEKDKNKQNQWKVKNIHDKWVVADNSSILNALNTLITQVKPTRLASRSIEKQSEFQVDSTGTRVQVFEGNKKTLDLIIGKFGMRDQRQYQSYVRLYEEKEIYACHDFMSIAFSSSPDSYRQSQVVQMNKESIQSISFIYQNDDSFLLKKIDNNWFIEEKATDSASVDQYLNSIGYININNFADDIEESSLHSPISSIIINTNDSLESSIELEAYINNSNIVLKSSTSPNLYLDDDSTYLKKIFKIKEDFFAKE